MIARFNFSVLCEKKDASEYLLWHQAKIDKKLAGIKDVFTFFDRGNYPRLYLYFGLFTDFILGSI